MRLALEGFYNDFRIYFSKKPSGNFENKIYDSQVLEHRWHTREPHSKVVGRDGGSIHLGFLQLQGSPSGNGDSFPPVTPLRGDSNILPGSILQSCWGSWMSTLGFLSTGETVKPRGPSSVAPCFAGRGDGWWGGDETALLALLMPSSLVSVVQGHAQLHSPFLCFSQWYLWILASWPFGGGLTSGMPSSWRHLSIIFLKKKSRQNSCFFLNSLLEMSTLNLGVILDSIQALVTSVHFCVLLRSWFCPSPYASFHYLLLGSSHCLFRSPARVSARELFKIHTLNRPQNILLWHLPMLCGSYALSPPPRAACVYFYPHVFLSLLFWYSSSLDESHTASSGRFIIPNNCLLN